MTIAEFEYAKGILEQIEGVKTQISQTKFQIDSIKDHCAMVGTSRFIPMVMPFQDKGSVTLRIDMDNLIAMLKVHAEGLEENLEVLLSEFNSL